MEISESRLKLQNLYTVYPIPDDPGLAPAFWITDERRAVHADNEMEKFLNFARSPKIRPIKCLGKMLDAHEVNLRHYGIDSRIVRALCDALAQNVSVHTLDVTGNRLTPDACYHLGDLLSKNHVITKLSLTGCRIGSEGAKKLVEGLSAAVAVVGIDLDSCNLADEGFKHVADAVSTNETLERLNLADNELTEESAEELQKVLSKSRTLRMLDLSWNSLYTTETWRKLAKGLAENEVLVDLDLTWNGLGKECVHHLAIILSRGNTLERLNLSGNQFTKEEAIPIGKALSKNKRLTSIYLGNNPLRAEGAFELVNAVIPERAPDSNLRLLDLENVWAAKDVLPFLEIIENRRPWLEIKLGGVLSNYKLSGPDARKIFLKRAKYEAMKPKKKRQRRNFGHFVLSLADNPVSKEKFRAMIRAFRLKLSKSLVEEIMNAFAGPKHTIDQGSLKSYYLQMYPDTTAPTIKLSKKKHKRYEEKMKELFKVQTGEEMKAPTERKRSKKESEKMKRAKRERLKNMLLEKEHEDEELYEDYEEREDEY